MGCLGNISQAQGQHHLSYTAERLSQARIFDPYLIIGSFPDWTYDEFTKNR